MDESIAIKVRNVSKRYTIGQAKKSSIKDTFNDFFTYKKNEEEFIALNDVSFEIKKGDVVGILGKNGAGKSTLLKLLSHITKPSTGRLEINGRIASLLEVGTGFHPELTGRENIFLNGTILGMSRKEIKTKFDEIVEFSGVSKFIDTPVKNYSSGMYVRLAFAVAAHLEPEILVIDEVLAVGDAEFQNKCIGKMKDVANHGRTVLFVSHDMNAISSLCKKSILLERGSIVAFGETQDVIETYLKKYEDIGTHWITERIDGDVVIKEAHSKLTGDQPDLKLHIEVKVTSNTEMLNSFMAFNIVNGIGQIVGQTIPSLKPFISLNNDTQDYRFEVDIDGFVPDDYYISIWIGPHFSHTLDWVKDVLKFQVIESPQKGRTFPHPRDHGAIVPSSRILNLS
jgi:lipopolysaccharide transport system ATP-binding protein